MNITKRLKHIAAIAVISALNMGASHAVAQELNCQVEINTSQIQGTNKSIFETLQSAITEYMNTTVFSNAQFAVNERIDCRLFFTITEASENSMTGNLQVQMTRPVYNSSYTTTVLNFKDSKIEFEYQENEPLIFSRDNMESQLTAILNFYAYLFLALDSDTFAPRGGEAFYDVLKQIVQMAQSSGESGWKAFEDTKNRSAVLSSLTDASTQCIRDLYYQYHRRGLDEMSTAPDKGRTNITASLTELQNVFQTAPMSVALSMFKDAKLDELVNVYSKAPAEERTQVADLLEKIYPTEQQRLEQIRKGKEK